MNDAFYDLVTNQRQNYMSWKYSQEENWHTSACCIDVYFKQHISTHLPLWDQAAKYSSGESTSSTKKKKSTTMFASNDATNEQDTQALQQYINIVTFPSTVNATWHLVHWLCTA